MLSRIGLQIPVFKKPLNIPAEPRFGRIQQAAAEDEFVRIERREIEKEEEQRLYMELPWFDYRRNAFNREVALEFADTKFGPEQNEAIITGREFLSFLVTSAAVDTQQPPADARQVDFTRLGKLETDLRQHLIDAGLPHYFYDDLVNYAFKLGLVYSLTDRQPNQEHTYYGVPMYVREALDIKSPDEATSVAEVAESPADPKIAAFVESLMTLAKQIQTLPPKDEMFEFMAGLLDAVRVQGLIAFEDMPEPLRGVTEESFIPTVETALLDINDAAADTPFEKEIGRLLNHAVAAHLLDEELL